MVNYKDRTDLLYSNLTFRVIDAVSVSSALCALELRVTICCADCLSLVARDTG